MGVSEKELDEVSDDGSVVRQTQRRLTPISTILIREWVLATVPGEVEKAAVAACATCDASLQLSNHMLENDEFSTKSWKIGSVSFGAARGGRGVVIQFAL